jgi:peptidoglycan/LPS O-acetylase OafA/YrhL
VPLFVWLGRISYGVYAIHLPIYQLVAYLLTTAPWGRQIRNAPLLLATLSGVMVIVLAHLLTAYFDEPLRRKLRSLPFLQPIRSEISHMDRP